ncbi:MAG: DUF485 domain-containing protein [Sulfurovaceae bacterium]|nr:DUF485 domain-containing protein [Sulfurovaceae bacterium]
MKQDTVKDILANPKYQELVTKRSKFAWTLSIIILVVYYAFVLVIAFDSSLLGIKVGSGVTTVGIPVGIGIILLSFILTGVYVKRANTEFDDLTNEVKKSIMKDK